MDYNKIIDKYYPEANRLRDILMVHSTLVTQRALKICDAHPELHLDRRFVEEAAMLHDIGICRCSALRSAVSERSLISVTDSSGLR